jgi:hypothetical protein
MHQPRAPLAVKVAPHIHRLHANCRDGFAQFVFAAAELDAPVTHEVLRVKADSIRSGRTYAEASRHLFLTPQRERSRYRESA